MAACWHGFAYIGRQPLDDLGLYLTLLKMSNGGEGKYISRITKEIEFLFVPILILTPPFFPPHFAEEHREKKVLGIGSRGLMHFSKVWASGNNSYK